MFSFPQNNRNNVHETPYAIIIFFLKEKMLIRQFEPRKKDK